MTFPCTKCGACCKAAGAVPGFPEPILPGTKTCVHLDRAGHCVVYETRPEVCRIGDNTSTYFENALACNELQRIFRVPPRYRVKLTVVQ